MSRKMKKSLQKQESQITLKNHNPGCMWGIFHNLQQNRWHKVVKRLPQRARLGHGKHSTGQEQAKTSSNAAQVQENADSVVEKPRVEAHCGSPSPVHKSSMRSRIKALITEEVCKRKIRHRRSTSYPIRPSPDQDIPSHHHKGQSLDTVLPAENSQHPVNVDPSNPAISSDPPSSNVRLHYLKQSEVDQLGDHPVRDHTLLHGNSMYAIEPSRGDSLHESKLFMNALTLLNVREEMFMKILKDPNSSLANQMHCRRPPNLRLGLNKSMSFSAPAPTAFEPNGSTKKQEETRCGEGEENNENSEADQQLSREAEVSDNSSPSAANILRKKSDERAGLMHFKNIREKIKFVIRDRKKEKNRIMMDALHHKIPYGTSASKKIAEDNGHQGSDFGNNSTQAYKRTSSFDNSLDRYNQLLDISSTKEAKDHNCEESKPKTDDPHLTVRRKPAILGRILSLPEIMRSYSYANNIDDCAGNSSSQTSDVVNVGSSSGINEEKSLDHLHSENGNKEEDALDVVGETSESKAVESGSSHNFIDESETSPAPPLPSKLETDENGCEYKKDEAVQEHGASVSDDSRQQAEELEPWFLSEDMIDLDVEEGELELYNSCVSSAQDTAGIVQESQIQQFYSELLHVQGDSKNNAEFNYVKGVLELSGFSKNETLGEWQSAEHPLDPSMFEEVGSSSAVDQSEYYGNEDGISNQLLLFDLINEVLLQVHERSFCYWPTPLTNRSSIHPLPKGSRVLEEVWADIRWLLRSRPQSDHDTDDAVTRDLAKNDGWMNLQLDAECVGIELEDLIFHDLLQEIFAAT